MFFYFIKITNNTNNTNNTNHNSLIFRPQVASSRNYSSIGMTPTLNQIFIRNFRQLASKLISALWVLKSEGSEIN